MEHICEYCGASFPINERDRGGVKECTHCREICDIPRPLPEPKSMGDARPVGVSAADAGTAKIVRLGLYGVATAFLLVFIPRLAVPGLVCGLVGTWLTTWPWTDNQHRVGGKTARVGAVCALFSLLLLFADSRLGASPLIRVPLVFAAAGAFVGMCALLTYVSTLAEVFGTTRLAAHAKLIAWAWPAIVVILFCVAIYQWTGQRASSNGTSMETGAVSAAVFLTAVLALWIFSIVTFVRLAVAVKPSGATAA